MRTQVLCKIEFCLLSFLTSSIFSYEDGEDGEDDDMNFKILVSVDGDGAPVPLEPGVGYPMRVSGPHFRKITILRKAGEIFSFDLDFSHHKFGAPSSVTDPSLASLINAMATANVSTDDMDL